MLRDNLVGLIEPMRNSAGADPLALSIQKQASDDRSICLENPRPEGAESSLTENVTSPFQAEPAHLVLVGFTRSLYARALFHPDPIPPYLYLHGIVLTSWFVLAFVQALLVSAGRAESHRRIGVVGA